MENWVRIALYTAYISYISGNTVFGLWLATVNSRCRVPIAPAPGAVMIFMIVRDCRGMSEGFSAVPTHRLTGLGFGGLGFRGLGFGGLGFRGLGFRV